MQIPIRIRIQIWIRIRIGSEIFLDQKICGLKKIFGKPWARFESDPGPNADLLFTSLYLSHFPEQHNFQIQVQI